MRRGGLLLTLLLLLVGCRSAPPELPASVVAMSESVHHVVFRRQVGAVGEHHFGSATHIGGNRLLTAAHLLTGSTLIVDGRRTRYRIVEGFDATADPVREDDWAVIEPLDLTLDSAPVRLERPSVFDPAARYVVIGYPTAMREAGPVRFLHARSAPASENAPGSALLIMESSERRDPGGFSGGLIVALEGAEARPVALYLGRFKYRLFGWIPSRLRFVGRWAPVSRSD